MLCLVLGLPGAGKTEHVKGLLAGGWSGAVVISYDSIRRAMGHEYNAHIEAAVHFVGTVMLRIALAERKDIIIDESITDFSLAAALVDIATEAGSEVVIHYLDTPVSVCRKRRVVDCNFPVADFERKVSEWGRNGRDILALGSYIAASCMRKDAV